MDSEVDEDLVALLDSRSVARSFRAIRPTRYKDPVLKDKLQFPFTDEYNAWRECVVKVAHLLQDKHGDLFNWDDFVDMCKEE